LRVSQVQQERQGKRESGRLLVPVRQVQASPVSQSKSRAREEKLFESRAGGLVQAVYLVERERGTMQSKQVNSPWGRGMDHARQGME